MDACLGAHRARRRTGSSPDPMRRRSAAPLPRGLIEQHAGSDGRVEALDRAGAGNRDCAVGLRRELFRDAVAFVADEQRDGAGEVHQIGGLRRCAGSWSRDLHAGLAQAGESTHPLVTVSSGTRKTLPAEARTALGFHALTVPGRQRMPLAPNASAERRIVPRLPGSCRPASTSTKGSGFAMIAEHVGPGPVRRFDQSGDGLRGFGGEGARSAISGHNEGSQSRAGRASGSSRCSAPWPQRQQSRRSPARSASVERGLGLRCRPGPVAPCRAGLASARRSSFKRRILLTLYNANRHLSANRLGSLSRFYAVLLRRECACDGDSTCTMAGAVIVSVFVASAIREPR